MHRETKTYEALIAGLRRVLRQVQEAARGVAVMEVEHGDRSVAAETYAERKLVILVREAETRGDPISDEEVPRLRERLLKEGARELELWRNRY